MTVSAMQRTNIDPNIERWTINCLPDKNTSDRLASYADNPKFDVLIRGYRAGAGHGTKPFSYPHVTLVHFECTEKSYLKIVNFVAEWLAKHPDSIKSSINNRIVEKTVPAGDVAYLTDQANNDKETLWIDYNLQKAPFMPLHTALVGYIKELSKNSGDEIKVVNGFTDADVDNYRPHFTIMRVDKNLAKTINYPVIDLSEDQVIVFTVSAGPSEISGEYTTPQFAFNEKGEIQ